MNTHTQQSKLQRNRFVDFNYITAHISVMSGEPVLQVLFIVNLVIFVYTGHLQKCLNTPRIGNP